MIVSGKGAAAASNLDYTNASWNFVSIVCEKESFVSLGMEILGCESSGAIIHNLHSIW